MLEEIKNESIKKMNKVLEALKISFAKVRTGRAHPSLLDSVKVEYYGSLVPLSQVANISVEDNRTLKLTVWEQSMVAEVDKAIIKSDLGLNPSSAGVVIFVPLPALTEETRNAMIKKAREIAEQSRIAIRNIRRDAMEEIKFLEKEKEISQDQEKREQDNIEKLTQQYITKVNHILDDKELDLKEV